MPARRYNGVERQSLYLRMRDGVRIAIDVSLPADRGAAKLPTILRQTRYHRRMAFAGPLNSKPAQKLFDQHHDARRYFVEHGYAWVDVCTRGSGASGGMRISPWSPDEIEDGREILDWIVGQSWSNGNVGARGVSYDGTAAEFLLQHQHPALKAVVPRFSLYDAYEDIAMPGGIHLAEFTKKWAAFNEALDENRFDKVLKLIVAHSYPARLQLASSDQAVRGDGVAARAMRAPGVLASLIGPMTKGVASVDDDDGRALQEHVQFRTENVNVHDAAEGKVFRDDRGMTDRFPDMTIDDFSPHTRDLKGVIYHYSGWYDGAYQRAAIKRFLAHDNPEHHLILGPWEHGGKQQISPWNKRREPAFDHDKEMRRFFDAYLVGDAHSKSVWAKEPRVKYYTLGQEQWKYADTWPPPGFRDKRFCLADSGLSDEPAEGDALVSVTGKHGSGAASRWRCLLPILSLTHYTPQVSEEIIHFDSPAFEADHELTGHPILQIEFESTSPDPRIFAYLEDVAPDGSIKYVTEGMLRAIHRREKRKKPSSHGPIPYRTYLRADKSDTSPGIRIRMKLDLLPVSYLFRKGHRIRLGIAGADADHFEVGPHGVHNILFKNSWLQVPMRKLSQR